MKGIIFTNFIALVEEKFGIEIAEGIISESSLASEGAYTNVGTYHHQEIFQLANRLSEKTGLTREQLFAVFGEHVFKLFVAGYPQFFLGVKSSFDFLMNIEGYIHVEVRKLYPDAELPTFNTSLLSPTKLEMIYKSERKMADFAHGLIKGCLQHFQQNGTIAVEKLTEQGDKVRFVVEIVD